MVQFNLLPDIKLEYVKAQRTKYLMTFAAFVVGAVSIAVLLFALFFVNVVQRKSLSDLNTDIKAYSKQLKSVNDLSKILTVQNQLSTLTSLHDKEPVATRLFGYLTQITPAQASLTKLSVDFTQNTMSISGTAPNLDTVRVYADALKSATYMVDGSEKNTKVFNQVVLSQFGRDDKGATFTITMNFDPVIFDATKDAKLSVSSTTGADETNLFTTGQ